MSKVSKLLVTDTDPTPTAIAVADGSGEPATDLIVVLTGVVQKLPDGTGVFDDLMEARHLLESLPLTTSDFAIAANRGHRSYRDVTQVEDSVTDRSAGDSVTHFRNLEQRTDNLTGFGNTTFGPGTWTDANIETIDEALRNLHQITDNTRLLKTATGGDLVFERAGNQLSGTANIGGWNSGNGYIAFTNNGMNSNSGARITTYRKVAHNWDEAHENGRIPGFRQLSDWRQGSGTGFAQGGDGSNWHYRTDSVFARNDGRFNPLEDFATTWESYFDRRFHNNEYRLNHVAGKHAVLDSFNWINLRHRHLDRSTH